MKILIELPTWLGDCVMATPAIENIIDFYKNDVEIVVFGSYVSLALFENHPKITQKILDNSKSNKLRFYALYKLSKRVKNIDVFFSFRKSFSSKIFKFFINAKQKFQYSRLKKEQIHQVIRYNDFINKSLNFSSIPNDLKIYFKANQYNKPTLGINPGATYGSAKRWYPKKFANVCAKLSNTYDIIIFGGPNEIEMAQDIENELIKKNITNFTNLAGQTTVPQLIKNIAGLNLFITNDSGPMHIASAFKVPTVSIFGPTKDIETSQWNNPNAKIVRFDIECAPCMKRVCPLGHHECMKNITEEMVLKAINF